MWEEHVSRQDPSVVSLGVWAGKLRMRVGRGALERLPWFRGGATVSVMLGRDADWGRMRVQRGMGHRLLTRMSPETCADRLPPVDLLMDAFPWMRGGMELGPDAVLHSVGPEGGLLEIVLPVWAMPPIPPATRRHLAGYFLPFEGARP